MKTLRLISKNRAFTHLRILAAVVFVLTAAALVLLAVSPPASAQPTARPHPLTPKFSKAVAFDVSPALRSLPQVARPGMYPPNTVLEVRPERRGSEGREAHRVKPYSADGVLQMFNRTPTIPAPLLTFEGLSNQDNFNIFGFRINPGDPNGEVGPNNFVEMINLVFAVYDKAGNLLAGPIDTGSLWRTSPSQTAPILPVIPSSSMISSWIDGCCRSSLPAALTIRRNLSGTVLRSLRAPIQP